jgi:hypothetical protein
MGRAREHGDEERDIAAAEMQMRCRIERVKNEKEWVGFSDGDLPEVLPHCILELRETLWTVGVGERAIGGIHAICPSIRPLRDPAFTISGRFGLVSKEPAGTTDREQGPRNEPLSHRTGGRLANYLS